MKKLFKNAEIFVDGGLVRKDIAMDDGRIVSIDNCASEISSDLTDCIIVPGFADVHVHLREPGFFYKGSIACGTRAAAKGGYTSLCSMPNLNPPPDCLENLRVQTDIIKTDAVVDVLPYGCITMHRDGKEIANLEELAPFVAGYSDDGSGVGDKGLMREALQRAKKLDKVVAAHCEVIELVAGGCINDCEFARQNGIKGINNESEYRMVERDISLAYETGAKYHVCHASTKETVQLVRDAKRSGIDVTCETAPHYLILDDRCLKDEGRFKMNPPLRDKTDREAILEGLADGTIDMIATDHAPHSAEEKSRGLRGSPMGIVGLETAFPLLYTYLVKKGLLSLDRLLYAMCVAPRKRFGPEGGSLSEGSPADLAVIHLNKSFTIRSEEFLSKGKSTPFDGMEVFGKVILTLKNGRTVWKENTIEN